MAWGVYTKVKGKKKQRKVSCSRKKSSAKKAAAALRARGRKASVRKLKSC